MRLKRKFTFLFIFAFVANSIFAARSGLLNPSEQESQLLSRQKRFLIFPNGGVAKFVAGYLGPVDTEAFINCNAIRNIQFQYDAPPNTTSIFSRVPARPQGRNLGGSPSFKSDLSRKIAYGIVEDILRKEGKNGRECLLRTICEVAETPVNHDGLIGELLQLFFTPGKYEKVHEDYRHARKVGLNRVNCERMYPDCPFGHGLLDSISLIEDYKFKDWLNF